MPKKEGEMDYDVECEDCGETPSYILRYFFDEEDATKLTELRIRLCRSCILEFGKICSKHGPCIETDSRYFITDEMLRVNKKATVRFCPKCVHTTAADMDKKERESCQRLLRRYLLPVDYVHLLALERMFLPKKTWDRYPVIASCSLRAYMFETTIEAIVLSLVDQIGYRSPLYERPRPLLRLYDELPQ